MLRVNRWRNVMIKLVCTKGDNMEYLLIQLVCAEGEQMEKCDDTACVCGG